MCKIECDGVHPLRTPRYKEVWCPQNAHISFGKNSLYEAGGVISWLNPLQHNGAPVDAPSFKQVVKAEKRLHKSVRKGSNGKIIFPYPVHVYLLESKALEQDKYPEILYVSAGHALVCGWWATWAAIEEASYMSGKFMLRSGSLAWKLANGQVLSRALLSLGGHVPRSRLQERGAGYFPLGMWPVRHINV